MSSGSSAATREQAVKMVDENNARVSAALSGGQRAEEGPGLAKSSSASSSNPRASDKQHLALASPGAGAAEQREASKSSVSLDEIDLSDDSFKCPSKAGGGPDGGPAQQDNLDITQGNSVSVTINTLSPDDSVGHNQPQVSQFGVKLAS